MNEETYKPFLDKGKVLFFGNGAAKCKTTINHPNAIFVDDIKPLAKNMVPLAERLLMNNKTEDVAYFEPRYLKDFIAGTSKKLF